MRLIDIVNKFPDKYWNWNNLSCNSSITFDDVLSNPDKPWNWYFLSSNSNITFDHVLECPHQPWNWEVFSSKVIKFPQQRIEFLDLLSKI